MERVKSDSVSLKSSKLKPELFGLFGRRLGYTRVYLGDILASLEQNVFFLLDKRLVSDESSSKFQQLAPDSGKYFHDCGRSLRCLGGSCVHTQVRFVEESLFESALWFASLPRYRYRCAHRSHRVLLLRSPRSFAVAMRMNSWETACVLKGRIYQTSCGRGLPLKL